jgi:hypothetical protein
VSEVAARVKNTGREKKRKDEAEVSRIRSGLVVGLRKEWAG